jgi:hypothetical protein
MKGLDYVEKTYPFIDKNREAALGASYGGYMANWLLGHTNRFKCIVSHDGVFNAESAYGTTEELWFSEWEFKGAAVEESRPLSEVVTALFADKFKTPTLVVHGQNDYRLDVSQGFDLFTDAATCSKVPSKDVVFPGRRSLGASSRRTDRLWYKTVNGLGRSMVQIGAVYGVCNRRMRNTLAASGAMPLTRRQENRDAKMCCCSLPP